MDNLAFDFLEVGEADRLEVSFEEREVLEVVRGMDRDKAPGPDGFSMAFFQLGSDQERHYGSFFRFLCSW